MYGTVKFIGNVRGKGGVFVGVELEGDLAGRGKNDGAVDG
jgi:dynactin complex subunit